MKTAVSVLQEMMVKIGQMPEYECVSQSGLKHQALFEYRCLVKGEAVSATARSKKEAKQEAARVMLQLLASKGYPVPPPYGFIPRSKFADDEVITAPLSDTRSYVALLKELSEEYRLPPVEYELIGDTGPPHLRHFTVRARLGNYERLVTSTTKRAARQLAAEQLYTYLRKSLARLTQDFDEMREQTSADASASGSPRAVHTCEDRSLCDAALARAHDKAMDRYEGSTEVNLRRPDLGQKVYDYPVGLTARLDPEVKQRAAALLKASKPRESHSPERIMSEMAEAMGLELSYIEMPCYDEGRDPGMLLDIACTSPQLCFFGMTAKDAAASALQYFNRSFRLSKLI